MMNYNLPGQAVMQHYLAELSSCFLLPLLCNSIKTYKFTIFFTAGIRTLPLNPG